MSMVPKSIGSGLKMLGIGRRRMWSIGGALKGAAMLKKKIKQLPVAAGSKCLKTFGNALCDKAYKKACGRRLISIPGPIKSVFKQVWGAIKGAVKAVVMSMVPKSIGSGLKMLGIGRRRMWSIGGALKSVAKKAGKMAKKGACAAFGAKGLAMCKQAVAAGVKKGAAMLK